MALRGKKKRIKKSRREKNVEPNFAQLTEQKEA